MVDDASPEEGIPTRNRVHSSLASELSRERDCITCREKRSRTRWKSGEELCCCRRSMNDGRYAAMSGWTKQRRRLIRGAWWQVHKFGGASLADAALYQTCGNLLIEAVPVTHWCNLFSRPLDAHPSYCAGQDIERKESFYTDDGCRQRSFWHDR